MFKKNNDSAMILLNTSTICPFALSDHSNFNALGANQDEASTLLSTIPFRSFGGE